MTTVEEMTAVSTLLRSLTLRRKNIGCHWVINNELMKSAFGDYLE